MTMRRRFLVAAGASLVARPLLTRAAARDPPPRIGILNFGDPPPLPQALLLRADEVIQ